jgi:heptosyltransferase-1
VVTRGRHVIEQNVSVAEAMIGHRVKPPGVQFPFDPAAESRVEQRLAEFAIEKFAVLNPGAGWGAKRWPAERYGEVARGLAELGLQGILNYGPGEDELARAAEAASGGAARAMSSTLTELIALTRRTRLFVGGDTGPLHLAAALRVPVVGIYGPTDPARNGPYGTRSVVLRSAESVTSHARRAAADEGMLGISSEAVVVAARGLMGDDWG